MNSDKISKFINKRNAVLLVLLFVIGFGLLWLSSHSYIEVRVPNSQSDQEVEIVIDGESTKTKDAFMKKLVKKGQHAVVVSQGDNSFFASVHTAGFLKTHSVSAELQATDSLTFAGNSVLPCGAYGVKGVYSWQCDGFLKSAVLHKPSTDSTPSVPTGVTNVDDPYYIESFYSTESTDYFIVRASDMDGSIHAALPVGADGKIQFDKNVLLESLNSNKIYGSTPYKNGVLFFSTSDKELVYYENIQGKGEFLVSPEVDTGDLVLQSVHANGDSILMAYTDSVSPEYRGELYSKGAGVIDTTVSETGKSNKKPVGNTTIVTINGEAVSSENFDFNISQARYCGNYVCLLHDDKLEIVDPSNKNKNVTTLNNVSQINSFNETVFIADEKGVMLYDTKNNTGYYTYNFGEYDFCGMRVVSSKKLMVCIQNGRSKQVVVLSPGQKTYDQIDKKVIELAKLSEVKTVSTFGNLIHVSPELGELVFNNTTKELEYDESKKKLANDKINQKVKELGIDTARYRVINIINP